MTFGMLTRCPSRPSWRSRPTACLGVTIAAIVITVFWALRVVHSERLVFAPHPL
jgi:hypothetical protein